MQYPQINLNGSDAIDLAVQYHDAARSLEVACLKMSSIPHGRDYQTLPAGSYEKAREEMHHRVKAISVIMNELEELASNCVDQENRR